MVQSKDNDGWPAAWGRPEGCDAIVCVLRFWSPIALPAGATVPMVLLNFVGESGQNYLMEAKTVRLHQLLCAASSITKHATCARPGKSTTLGLCFQDENCGHVTAQVVNLVNSISKCAPPEAAMWSHPGNGRHAAVALHGP